jgi:phage repressor protein C with HTH and peptisase S24 domain
MIAARRRHSAEGDCRFYATVTTDDMSQRFHKGERIIYNTSIRPVIGDDVLIIRAGDSEDGGLIRRLVGFDGRNLKLLQFNPKIEADLAITEVRAVYPCVGAEYIRAPRD